MPDLYDATPWEWHRIPPAGAVDGGKDTATTVLGTMERRQRATLSCPCLVGSEIYAPSTSGALAMTSPATQRSQFYWHLASSRYSDHSSFGCCNLCVAGCFKRVGCGLTSLNGKQGISSVRPTAIIVRGPARNRRRRCFCLYHFDAATTQVALTERPSSRQARSVRRKRLAPIRMR